MDRTRVIAQLAERVAAVAVDHPTRVAVDGVDAAGKTFLADELAEALKATGRQVIRASIDGFHNPAAIRKRRGSLSPEGYFLDSFDCASLLSALLVPLGPGGSRVYRRAVFDFRTDAAVDSPAVTASPDAVLILDGVFLLRRELRNHFDFSIFVRADFKTTMQRAEARDLALFGTVEEIRRRYEQRYVPGQRLYLESERPEDVASVVIDNDDWSRPALESRPAGGVTREAE